MRKKTLQEKQKEDLINYIEKNYQRTAQLIQLVPNDKIDWTPAEDRFTIGDLIRHLAAVQRFMYAENAMMRPTQYKGCGKNLAATYEEVMAFHEEKYKESMEIFKQLTAEDLYKKCLTPTGIEISTAKWLRAMLEHEAHHRGQLYVYLAMLNVKTPPIFGLNEAELVALTNIDVAVED
jgi:uncharacterized damage-inducible protein DinB